MRLIAANQIPSRILNDGNFKESARAAHDDGRQYLATAVGVVRVAELASYFRFPHRNVKAKGRKANADTDK